MKIWKKLAFVLAALMVLSSFSPISVIASESETFNFDTTRVGYAVANVKKADTTGAANIKTIDESSVPTSGTYLISDKAGLDKLSKLVNSGNALSGVTFVQTADIDMSTTETDQTPWTPIGYNATAWDSTPFSGIYDGQGYTIGNMVFSPNTAAANTSIGLLFSCCNGAIIQNVVMDNTCSVTWYGAGSSPEIYMGSILGRDAGKAVTVSNCYSAATLKNTNTNNNSTAAGIWGNVSVGGGKVEYCTFAGSVQGFRRVGGIIAYVMNCNTTITNCCNMGTVTSLATSEGPVNAAGGICGAPNNNDTSKTTITNCMNYGTVSAAGSDQFVGGIIGCVRTYNYASGNIDYGNVYNVSGVAPTTIYGKSFPDDAEPTKNIDASSNKVLRGVGKAETHGYQIKANGTDAVDIRFVGSIDGTSYSAVGMEITVTYTYNNVTHVQKLDPEKEPAKYAGCVTTTVYESLTAIYDGENVSYTAKDLREDQANGYLFSVILDGVPKAAGDLTVTVVPFCKDTDDTSVVYEGMPKSTVIDLGELPDNNVSSEEDQYNDYTNFTLNIGDPILITHGDTLDTLGWGPYQFPFLYFTKFGSIICSWSKSNDKITGGTTVEIPSSAVSDDGGLTWRERTESDTLSYESRSLMSNGKYFAGFVGKNAYVVEGLDEKYESLTPNYTYEGKKLFLPSDIDPEDLDLTYQAREYDPNTGTVTTFDCTVNWPTQLISVYYTIGNKDYEDNTIHPPQREFALGNGLCDLAVGDKLYYSVYARGLDPETLELGKYSEYFSVFIFCSEDNARTWNLVSQVDVTDEVFEESKQYTSTFGGLSEPTMSLMPDGSIVMLMRTGDNRPCYLVRSTDGCKTWSDPVKFDEVGVRPFIVTLDCGVTLASYGRDGLFLRATSDSEGLVWQDHIEIPLSDPQSSTDKRQSCYYTYILPLSETSALFVYSDFHYSPTGEAADAGKSMIGRIITIEPHKRLALSDTPGVGNSKDIDCSNWLNS